MAGEYTLSVLMNARNNASGPLSSLIGALKGIPGPVMVAGAAVAAMGGIVAIAVDKAQNFQSQMTTLKTGAGELQKNMGLVSQGLLNMSVATATSTDALTSSMFMVESAGYHGSQGLQVELAAAQGAKVGHADLTGVTDVLTTSLHNYHMETSQSIPVVNSFIKTVSSGKMVMNDLTEAMTGVLPAASKAGVKLTDVEGAIATMSLSGDRGAEAGTHLSQMFLSLQNPTSAATSILKKAGLTTQQISDDMKKSLPDTLQLIYDHLAKKFPVGSAAFNAAAAKIVGGNKQVKAWNELTGKSFGDLISNTKGISDAYKHSGNAVTGFSDVQNTFKFRMEAASAAINKAFIELGMRFLPVLTQLLSYVPAVIDKIMGFGTTIGNIVEWFQKVQGPGEILRAVIIGIGAAFLAIQIGTFLATIPALVAGFIAWAVAAGTAAIATIAATWPLLAIGAAIAAAVAIIILVVTHWGQIGNWLKGVWNAISAWFRSTLSGLASWFNSTVSSIASWFKSTFSSIGAFFHGLWTGIVNFFKSAWSVIVTIVKVGALLVLAVILGPFLAVGALFIWLYNHNYYFKALIDAIVNFVKAGVAWLINAWTTVTNWIVDKWNFLKMMATLAFQYIYNTIATELNRAKSFIQAVWNAAVSIIQGQLNRAKSFIQAVWSAMVSIIQGQLNRALSVIHSVWNAIVGVFQSAWSRISGVLSGLWSGISGWFSRLAGQAVSWGANLISGFISGIASKIGGVFSTIGGMMHGLVGLMGFHSPTKEGPGRDADKWAPNLMKMYTAGIVSGTPAIHRAATGVGNALHQGLTGGSSGLGLAGSGGGGRVVNIIIQAPFMDAKAIAKEVQKVQDGHYRLQGTHTTVTSGGKR